MPSNSCWFSGSRPLVGSSRMSSRGRCMKARISTKQRHEHPDGGRLARAVRSEEAEHVALVDLEGDVGDAALAAVALCQFFRFDDRRHVPFLLAEPETKGRVVCELHGALRNSQNLFERPGVGRDSTLNDLETDAAGLARNEEIGGLQLEALHEGHQDPRRLVWRIDEEGALVDALPHDRGEEGHHDAFRQAPNLLSDDRVAVRVPDLDDRQHQVLLLGLQSGDAGKDLLELGKRRKLGVVQDWRQRGHRAVGEALDDSLEQRLLGVEVVVEGALRSLQLVQQVLDAHGLIALGLDEALGYVEEGVPADRVKGRVDRPSHGAIMTDRRSVCLSDGVQPPAIAPMTRYGSRPVATSSGSGASGDSSDRSSSHAKNLSIALRRLVVWSRMVPRSIGYSASRASSSERWLTGPSTCSCTSLPTPARVRRFAGSSIRITLAFAPAPTAPRESRERSRSSCRRRRPTRTPGHRWCRNRFHRNRVSRPPSRRGAR